MSWNWELKEKATCEVAMNTTLWSTSMMTNQPSLWVTSPKRPQSEVVHLTQAKMASLYNCSYRFGNQLQPLGKNTNIWLNNSLILDAKRKNSQISIFLKIHCHCLIHANVWTRQQISANISLINQTCSVNCRSLTVLKNYCERDKHFSSSYLKSMVQV